MSLCAEKREWKLDRCVSSYEFQLQSQCSEKSVKNNKCVLILSYIMHQPLCFSNIKIIHKYGLLANFSWMRDWKFVERRRRQLSKSAKIFKDGQLGRIFCEIYLLCRRETINPIQLSRENLLLKRRRKKILKSYLKFQTNHTLTSANVLNEINLFILRSMETNRDSLNLQ